MIKVKKEIRKLLRVMNDGLPVLLGHLLGDRYENIIFWLSWIALWIAGFLVGFGLCDLLK